MVITDGFMTVTFNEAFCYQKPSKHMVGSLRLSGHNDTANRVKEHVGKIHYC